MCVYIYVCEDSLPVLCFERLGVSVHVNAIMCVLQVSAKYMSVCASVSALMCTVCMVYVCMNYVMILL